MPESHWYCFGLNGEELSFSFLKFGNTRNTKHRNRSPLISGSMLAVWSQICGTFIPLVLHDAGLFAVKMSRLLSALHVLHHKDAQSMK